MRIDPHAVSKDNNPSVDSAETQIAAASNEAAPADDTNAAAADDVEVFPATIPDDRASPAEDAAVEDGPAIIDTLKSSSTVVPTPKPAAPVNEGFGFQSTAPTISALYDDDLFALGVIIDDDFNSGSFISVSSFDLTAGQGFRPADLFRPSPDAGSGDGGSPPPPSYDFTINGTAGHDFISNLHIGTVTNLNPVGSPFYGPARFYFDHLPGQEYSWDGAVFTSTIDASTFDPYAAVPPAGTYAIYGDDGTDFIIALTSDGLVDAGNGNNSIEVYGNNNTVQSGDGNDLYYVSGNNNTINGGEASDRIVVRGDNNTIETGGSDVGHNMGSYYVSVSGNNNTINADDVEGWHAVYGDDNVMNTYGGEDDITISGNRNTLDAGADNDHITIDGDENDLYGGAGADWFDFQAGSADNVIHDFNRAEGDFIDIRDILSGYDHGVDDADDFIQLVANGADTDVYVSASGDGNFDRLATIIGGFGGASVDDLITNGSLAVADM